MGCSGSASAEDIQKQLEAAEYDVLLASGVPVHEFSRKYIVIDKDGPFVVRTVVHGGDLPGDKPTLVLTHGYGMASCLFYLLFKDLVEHYRVILVDNLSLGLNTKSEEAVLPKNSEEADEWMTDYWHQWVTQMGEQLPPKFLLSGHSFGGYQFHLYASAYPERVSGVFFMSPASTEFYDSSDVDPYQIRLQDDTAAVPTRRQVDQGIRDLENLIVPMQPIYNLPGFVQRSVAASFMKSAMPRESAQVQAAAGALLATMVQRQGRIDSIVCVSGRYFCYNTHSMFDKDRFGNPDIDFPIAYCFGDRDFLGSDAAKEIVRQNPHFESGRSQLFKLDNSGHNVFLNNPKELARYMIGFFNGTITGTFEEKPRKDWIAPHQPYPEPASASLKN